MRTKLSESESELYEERDKPVRHCRKQKHDEIIDAYGASKVEVAEIVNVKDASRVNDNRIQESKVEPEEIQEPGVPASGADANIT